MIGLHSIGVYLPSKKIDNRNLSIKFDCEENFLRDKLGFLETNQAKSDEGAFEMGVQAIQQLVKHSQVSLDTVELLIVVTQTPGPPIPHVSALIHGKMNFPQNCACFDISLGCSGYVYALSIAKSIMEAQGMRSGIVVTSDPYSKIVDPNDRNTAMLFGDGATATLLTDHPKYLIGQTTLNTDGSSAHNLMTGASGNISMNGRAVFTFCAQKVPPDILSVIEKNDLTIEDIDLFLVHQGSKFIVETIRNRLKLSEEKMPFGADLYGNTVSSSIPLLLAENLDSPTMDRILLSGFGVGLSWASTLLLRTND